MHCILHIGTDKTGSTALQEAMAAQRRALLERGICYPLAGAMFGRHRSRHAGFRLAFEELEPSNEGTHGLLGLGSAEGIERHRRRFVEEFDRELSGLGGSARVILSDEDLFVTSHPPMMREAHRFLRHRFAQLTLVLYLRDLRSYLASAYSQQIKMGRTCTFGAYVDGFLAQGGLSRRVQAWRELVGPQDTRILRYARARLPRQDVVADFSRRFDLGLAPQAPARPNRSLRPAGVDLLRAINRRYAEGTRPAWIRTAFQWIFQGDALPLFERLPPESLERIDAEQGRLDALLRADPD
jgi:hypothetical protein